ncbi:MAG: hypothetical protein AB1546_09835, partial [bacterium]
KYPADLVFIGDVKRTYTLEETKKKMFGLKREKKLKRVFPVAVMILDARTLQPLYQGEMAGEALVGGLDETDLSSLQIRSLNRQAFANFCERLTYFLLDHYNLIGFGIGEIPVKYKIERGRAARYM